MLVLVSYLLDCWCKYTKIIVKLCTSEKKFVPLQEKQEKSYEICSNSRRHAVDDGRQHKSSRQRDWEE